MTREAYRQIFSAVHHMEWIGFQLADQYCALAQSHEEQSFSSDQRKEEGGHVAVCKRLTRLFGELEPPSANLARMERALVGSPHKATKLLGLLGGDIMGDFLIRRLLVTPLPAEAREALEVVLADEVKHIAFLRTLLARELAELPVAARASCIWTQIILLVSDILETRRLAGAFRSIGLDPQVESVLCYRYYREQCAPLASTRSMVMLPPWLVRLASPAAYQASEAALSQLPGGVEPPEPAAPGPQPQLPGPHAACRLRALAAAEQAVREGLHTPSTAGLAAPFAAVGVLYACAVLAARASWPAAIAFAVAGGFAHVVMAFIGHDASHGCYGRSPIANDAVGLWMFVHSFTNYFGFRAMHRGHHRNTGFDEDPSGDSPKHARRVGVLTHTLLVFLPLGFPLLVIAPSWLGGFGFQPAVYKPAERWRIRAAMPVLVLYHWMLFHLLGAPAYGWFLGTFALGLCFTTLVLSLSHAGVEMYTDCKLCNTRTVASGPLLGLLTANGGYHVEHHITPQVPWYRIRRVHEILRQHGGGTYVSESFIALHATQYALYWRRLLGTPAFDWLPTRPHCLFLWAAHAVSVYTVVWRWSWAGALSVLAMHAVFGCLGITLGYHRLLTHRSFSTPRWLERALAVVGALALQGDPAEWVSVHRQHHRFSDREGDPHDASRGFWFSHMGWIDRHYFPHVTAERLEQYAPDLVREPFYAGLRRAYLPLVLAWVAACWAVAGWDGILWGLFVRLVVTDHFTWFVNSAGHSLGYQAYRTGDLSTNCFWTALVSFGEGWHNNHHAFPASARHGLEWWQLDLTWAAIRALSLAGLATAVRLPPGDARSEACGPSGAFEALGLVRAHYDSAEPATVRSQVLDGRAA
ncbi:MAG: fatty acid desaturase [Candidatus Wallbacteria bacterium]|nr:fatty acid desaturase [Candidatus Wallbacteria bacterium]